MVVAYRAPMQRGPVIIEAAINGSTTKDQNPHVPRSPEEIAADIVACLDAGAAIIHNHAAVSGPPDAIADSYQEGWRAALTVRPDALVYPTVAFTEGRLSVDHVEVLAGRDALRIGICDPGSVNLGGAVDGLPVGGFVYANSFDDIAHMMAMHTDQRIGPSFAIYEPGFLRAALAWWRAGRLPAGSMFKFYLSSDRGLMGAPFGLPPTTQALDVYVAMMGDCPVPWAVSVVGGDVVGSGLAEHAIGLGGHLHLGLEFFHDDVRRPTNVELVEEAVALCRRLGVDVATCDEAAAILELPRTTIAV
jgi:3-keto-5-aminohexanoate cleavage enzyme